jgi:hypothetical protein
MIWVICEWRIGQDVKRRSTRTVLSLKMHSRHLPERKKDNNKKLWEYPALASKFNPCEGLITASSLHPECIRTIHTYNKIWSVFEVNIWRIKCEQTVDALAIVLELWRFQFLSRLILDVARVWQVGFVVAKVALGQVFSEYFGFPRWHKLNGEHLHPFRVQFIQRLQSGENNLRPRFCRCLQHWTADESACFAGWCGIIQGVK